jgi:hypothetical protein
MATAASNREGPTKRLGEDISMTGWRFRLIQACGRDLSLPWDVFELSQTN